MWGPQTTFRIVSVSERKRVWIPARSGSPSPFRTAAGLETARAVISRTKLRLGSCFRTARHSLMKESNSNTGFTSFRKSKLQNRPVNQSLAQSGWKISDGLLCRGGGGGRGGCGSGERQGTVAG